MRKVRGVLAVVVMCTLLLGVMAPSAVAVKPLLPTQMGARAYSYVQQLSEIPRVSGSAGEVEAAMTVKGWFEELGYSPSIQPFSYEHRRVMYDSQNVIVNVPAARPAPRRPGTPSAPLVIVGAHYDKVPVGKGSDDNASGVGVLLEVAERISKYRLPYDVTFIAFGAEEHWLRGSEHFVDTMDPADLERTIAMINFDSLIVGDKLYIHAGMNEKTWARDAILQIIDRHKLPIEMQPGLNDDYPAGLSPGFSDSEVFDAAGIPVVSFESTNWELDDMDGYTQTEEYGSFWHTDNDDLAVIEELLPGRPMVRLHAFTTAAFEFLKHLKL